MKRLKFFSCFDEKGMKTFFYYDVRDPENWVEYNPEKPTLIEIPDDIDEGIDEGEED